MYRIPVRSSNLAAVGYDELSKVLEIEFRSGGIYQYFGVPMAVYQALMAAPSKGRYFDASIKYWYRWRRIVRGGGRRYQALS